MGRKHILNAYLVSTQADMSADFESKSTVVEQFDFISYTLDWGGGAGVSGEFFVEVSNDGTDWIELDFGQQILAGVDTNKDHILIKDVHFKYSRVKYVFAAGTGNCDITLKAGTKGA